MKYLTRWTVVIGLLFSFTFYPCAGLAIEDAIIAIVNDELITLNELKGYVQSTYISLVAEGRTDEEIQSFMRDMEANGTNKLIEDKLILSQANKVGIEVREELVDERIAKVREKYGSEQGLVDALVKNVATITDLRKKIRDQLKIK